MQTTNHYWFLDGDDYCKLLPTGSEGVVVVTEYQEDGIDTKPALG